MGKPGDSFEKEHRHDGEHAALAVTDEAGGDQAPSNTKRDADAKAADSAASRMAAAGDAEVYTQHHAHAVAEFNELTSGQCLGDAGKLDLGKVKVWQSEHGLDPDGKVGRLTLKAAKAGHSKGAKSAKRERPDEERGDAAAAPLGGLVQAGGAQGGGAATTAGSVQSEAGGAHAEESPAKGAGEQVASKPAAGHADPKAIKDALDSVQVVVRSENVTMLRPAKIFELVPWNTQEKAHAFRPVQRAERDLRSAQAAVLAASDPKAKAKALHKFEEATKHLEAASLGLKEYVRSQLPRIEKSDAEMKRYKAEEQEAKKRVAALQKMGDKAPAEDVKKAEAALGEAQGHEKGRHDALSAQIEGNDYGPSEVGRNVYRIVIDGEEINLYDHIEAYATTTEKGLDGKAKNEDRDKDSTVKDVLEKSAFSGSVKKILKTISDSEGGFSTVNTYDRAVLTWGFMQWTGGSKSDLTHTLAIIKRVAPEAFANRFQRYGIDVEKDQLVITGPDGTVKKGAAAAAAIQDSAVLTAVFSRAGMDANIQGAELTAAVEGKIDGSLNRHLNLSVTLTEKPVEGAKKEEGEPKAKEKKKNVKASVRVGDIITSEYGVGVLADASVHGGFPGAKMDKALERFLEKHDYDPKDVKKWAAEAEQALIPVIIAGWSDRAASFVKNGCSTDGGSFQR